MKKENKAFKNYYVYEMILILLLSIIIIPNIILTINNMIPFNIAIINTLLIIIIALPIAVFDIKNDLDIKNIYQYYLKEKKIPEYKDNVRIFSLILYNNFSHFFISSFLFFYYIYKINFFSFTIVFKIANIIICIFVHLSTK